MTPPVYFDIVSSPMGVLLIAHCSGYLCALDFQDHESRFRQMLARRFGTLTLEQRPAPDAIKAPLAAYLSGKDMGAVHLIPVHASGTRFQRQVWNALRSIPAGCLRSYADVARLIGQPSAIREVVSAAARNPLAIIVPCHRLVGSAGELVNYVGGLARKRWLLDHEGAMAAPVGASAAPPPSA
ncbi:MAG TPA: methylated-DNA--[protein]-cysteine S-methyltransferase [Moraxellaceae bacterium]|nr:methylated-DNA--[protein]-cysteine S-methyltransferase [Moraxellaceae bacterium]